MNVSYIVHISGKVQGVYFRASTQQVAIDNCISGYAKNLEDGDLEVLMSGKEADVEKMLEWLKVGPPDAEIDHVEQTKIAWQPHNFFSIN